MSLPNETIRTPYGNVGCDALHEMQRTYDTTALLRFVDELDAVLAGMQAADGLHDMLLRLHGMAHTVINGADRTVRSDGEGLPELAGDLAIEVQSVISTLQGWLQQIEPLERLAPRE
ncbi:Tn3 family transposase post-transcriptional regulator TnpC [Pandoraea sp. NPDC090278]|uniref:Tn3 family transposase post-transcriptional regulator TnpC n=1 Tax=Pandoraea sp. NPDC090278 TaxID=3364391 RepID=UPI00383BDD84